MFVCLFVCLFIVAATCFPHPLPRPRAVSWVTGDRYDPEPRTRRVYKDDVSERRHEEGGEEESRGREYHDEQNETSAVQAYRDEPVSKEEGVGVYHDEPAGKKDMQAWR